MKKFLLAAIISIAAISVFIPGANAASQDDVTNAARNAGISENYINQGLNMGKSFTSAQYDKMIDYINLYKNSVNKYLAKYFGGSASDYSSKASERDSDQNFINMTMAEKRSYISEMDESSRKEFISSMTNSERNSCIKQFKSSELSDILQPLVDFASSLGFNISIDDLTGDGLSLSIRNDDGNLLDVSTLGGNVDNVGYDYHMPIFLSIFAIATGIGGIVFVNKKLKDKGYEAK